MKMSVGMLRERIELQRKTVTRNAIGEEVVAWQPVATVWAALRRITTRDVLAAQQRHAGVDVIFVIRHRSDVAEDWRVIWRGQPYVIVGQPLDEDGRRMYLTLQCAAGLREG